MINVNGKVIDIRGNPVQSATVVIIGKGTTTSDASGNFSFTSVTTPYDLCTTASSGAVITVMKGATRADPTITSFVNPPTANTGTVTGQFTNGTTLPNALANRTNNLMFESAETTGNAIVTAPDAGYSVGVAWYGTTTTTGNVHGLQMVRSLSTQLPTATGYAYGTLAGVVLANGNTANMRNVSGAAVSAQLFSGTVSVPAVSNLMLGSKSVGLRIGNGAIPLATESNNTPTFSYQVPVVPNGTVTLTASAAGMNRESSFTKYGLPPNSTGVAVTLASPPQLSIPAAGATGIVLASQSFSWAPMAPAGLYSVTMVGGGRGFVIYTTQSSFTLPSTVELGLGTFPANTNFLWRVIGTGGGATSVDQLLGPRGAVLEAPATGDSWTGTSESRNFTGQ